MTLVLETGAGVRLANSYVTASYVTTYLTTRGRSTENSWDSATDAEKEDACIAATDYIEKRFRRKFRGQPRFEFNSVAASAEIQFTDVPSDTETLILGDLTYTFVTTLGDTDNSVLIGGTAAATASNLYDALTADDDGEDVTYANLLRSNRHVDLTDYDDLDSADTLEMTAAASGDGGNDTVLSTTAANITLTAFSGGEDGGEQPLSFPRRYMYDRLGNEIDGIPRKLKEATAEYAVRAHAATLLPDPTVDDSGGRVNRILKQVGPIRTETEYQDGTWNTELIKPYPAADRLLKDFIYTGLGAIR